MIYIYLLILCIFTVFSVFIYKKKVNPISLYCMIWFVISVLYSIGIVQTYPILYKTYIVLIGTTIIFSLGCLIGKVLATKNIVIFRYESNDEEKKKRLLQIIILLSIVVGCYIVPKFITIIINNGLNFSYIVDLYKEQANQEQESNLSLESLIYVLVVYAGFYIRKYGFDKKIIYVPIVLTVLSQLTSGTRGGYVICVCLFLASFTYDCPKQIIHLSANTKSYLKYTALIFIFILVFMTATHSRSSDSDLLYSGEFLKILPFSNVIYSVVLYVIGGIGCLNQYLINPIHDGSTPLFFRVPYIVTNKLGITHYDLAYGGYAYDIPFTSNVITYIGELYHDFGNMFYIVVLILSILFSYYYCKASRYGSLYFANLYSVFFSIFSLSWFVYIGRLANIWYVLVFGTLFSIYIEKNIKLSRR